MKELFSEKEVRELLKQEEGQFLEFKSLWNLEGSTRKTLDRRAVRDTIAQCVAAFANADGGTLLLGVDDDGSPSGHGYPDDVLDDFLAVPDRRLRPAVPVRHQRIRLDEKEIVVIQVGIEPEAVMVEADGFPYRVGDRIIQEPQAIIDQRKQAYRMVGFEQCIRSEATLDDLDLGLVKSFLSQSVYSDRSAVDVLHDLGLIVARARGTAVTNAALLLFAKRPAQRWHPRAGIRMFRVSGVERRHGKNRNVVQIEPRIESPLALALAEAQQLAAQQIGKSERLHDLFFREMPEYPLFAWQEAIVNAVAHRDYNDQGREIEIWFFDDRMEVLSPGDLIPPVTLDQLRSRQRSHASRNPLIVRVLAEAGIMRDEGEGVPRIFEEMEESLLRQPDISVDASQFSVVLHNEPVFTGPTAEWQGVVNRLELTNPQKRALLAYPNGFTNEEYRTLNNVDRDHAYREIQDMVVQGVLLPATSAGRGAVYRLSQGLRNNVAWLEQRVGELKAFLKTHDRLTNADYRSLFGVTRFTARHELMRLVAQGFLVQKGERKGTHYAPGASFPPLEG